MARPGQELASIDFESMLGGPLIAVVNAQAQAAMSSVNFIKSVGFESAGEDQDAEAPSVGKPIYVTFKYPKMVAPFQPGAAGELLGVTVTDAGQGYDPQNAPDVSFSGGEGSGAAATAVVGSDGKVVRIDVTEPGSGYTGAPQVTIGAATGQGARQATAVANVDAKADDVPAQFQEMKLEVPILTMLPIPFIRIDSASIDFNAKINSVEYTKTDTSLKVDSSASGRVRLGWFASAKFKVNTSYQRNTQQGTNVQRTYSMAVNIRAVQDEMPAGMERILGILEDAIQAQPDGAPAATEA